MLRLDLVQKLELNEQHSITLNSILKTPKTINEMPTKDTVDSIHDENEQYRRDSDLDF